MTTEDLKKAEETARELQNGKFSTGRFECESVAPRTTAAILQLSEALLFVIQENERLDNSVRELLNSNHILRCDSNELNEAVSEADRLLNLSIGMMSDGRAMEYAKWKRKHANK